MEHLLFVPGALVDELLHGLFGIFDVAKSSREWNPVHHGFDALALAILEQTTKVDPTPTALGCVEVVGIIPKPFQDFGSELWYKYIFISIYANKAAGRFRII